MSAVRPLRVYNQVSLDGYIADDGGDMSWAHADDEEWTSFVAENAGGGGELVFGRVTYELMYGYWASPRAMQEQSEVAQAMNALPKVVFSRTLEKATWSNTRLFSEDLPEAVRELKAEPGSDLVVMGSGSIVAQLCEADLVDEYQVVLTPWVLGGGKTMFQGITGKSRLHLRETRPFGNGNVVLRYAPSA